MPKRILSVALLLVAMSVFAQGPPAQSSVDSGAHPGSGLMRMPGPGGFFGMRQPVTNAPYSATFTGSSIEKLQDGSVLNHSTTRIEARDSLGRTREEVTMPARAAGETPRTMVMIFDPVAHTVTRLDPAKKVAIVHAVPTPGDHPGGFHGRRGPGPDGHTAPPPPPAVAGDQANAPASGKGRRGPHEDKNSVVADLGSKTIAGVVASGKRVTRTIPAGTMGNSAPIVSTRETWFSSDLGIELTRSDVDPFRGTHNMTVSGLTRTEPAATLFKAPSDYTVQQAPERAFGRGHGPRQDGPQPSGM